MRLARGSNHSLEASDLGSSHSLEAIGLGSNHSLEANGLSLPDPLVRDGGRHIPLDPRVVDRSAARRPGAKCDEQSAGQEQPGNQSIARSRADTGDAGPADPRRGDRESSHLSPNPSGRVFWARVLGTCGRAGARSAPTRELLSWPRRQAPVPQLADRCRPCTAVACHSRARWMGRPSRPQPQTSKRIGSELGPRTRTEPCRST